MHFTDEDCLWVANVAVAYFLEYWLENDTSARQTIYSFTKSPYLCFGEVDTDKLSRADSDMRIQLGRARENYQKLQRRRAEQIIDDEIYASSDRAGETKSKSGERDKFNFVELCWFDMWTNNKQLSLLDFISFGFEPDSHYTEDWWYKNLSSAYSSYYTNLERIDGLGISCDLDIEDFFIPYIARQYVASCSLRVCQELSRWLIYHAAVGNRHFSE